MVPLPGSACYRIETMGESSEDMASFDFGLVEAPRRSGEPPFIHSVGQSFSKHLFEFILFLAVH